MEMGTLLWRSSAIINNDIVSIGFNGLSTVKSNVIYKIICSCSAGVIVVRLLPGDLPVRFNIVSGNFDGSFVVGPGDSVVTYVNTFTSLTCDGTLFMGYGSLIIECYEKKS